MAWSKRVLPLVMERTLGYAVILVGLLLSHRLIVAPVIAMLRTRANVDFYLLEGILIAAVILVVPALPHGAEARDQSISLLRAKGIDAVIPFRTMLAEIIEKTQTNRNYQKSDLLQVVRILKNYEFIKEPQMELFKSRKSRRA